MLLYLVVKQSSLPEEEPKLYVTQREAFDYKKSIDPEGETDLIIHTVEV